MKRLISLLLVAVALPLIGDTYTDPFAGYTWTYSIHGSRGDRKAWISSFKFTPTSISTPLTGAVTIPVKLGGAVVVCIESYAFGNCSNLTSVTIPNSVVSIGASAFSGCSGLTSVTIPDSVTSIGGRAFQNCSGLASVTIGSGVKSIGDLAFYGCSGLTLITVDSNNQAYKSANGLLFTKDGTTLIQGTSGNVTIPDSVTSIGDHAFEYCSGLTSIEMPDSVTNIGKYAFRYCSGLTSIEMPDSVMSIGDSAFCYCSNLTSVTIGSGVKSIGELAFRYCSGLTSIEMPDGVTSIGYAAFNNCSELTAVHITDLAAWCGIRFSYGSNPLIRARNLYLNGELIKDLTIPSSVTSIGNHAFDNCRGLTSVTIPDSVTSIGDFAFRNCTSLTSVTIPDSVTSIGPSAFDSCTNLISVTIPNSVTNVEINAFAACKSVRQAVVPGWRCEIPFEDVADLEISDGTTRIGEHAFSGCSNLVSVIVPDSVTNICEEAFKDCISLRRIILPVCFRDTLDVPSVFGNGDNNFEILYLDSLCVLLNTPHLKFSRLKFSEPSNCFWSSDFAISHDGVSSARLKGMGQDSESSIELQLDSPGRLSFWWKASSESDGNNVFDYACLSIDGVPQGTLNKESYRLNGVAIGGKTGWRHEVVDVAGKGSHVIRWTYAKDEVDEGDTGDDCVWLDEVEFTPLVYLSFDIAGGIGTAPAEISELEGTVVTLPAQSGFEWEDHVFNGWSDGKATYAAESQYVVPASNVTFTAQWIAKRFLTFSLDGGEGQIPVTLKDVPGAEITLPSANGISRTKHVFVGWSDGAMTYDAGANYRVTDANVEFKAVWQRKEAHVSIVSDDVVNGGTVDTAGATISMSAWSNPSVGTPEIYYTLDGTEPTKSSTRYEAPFFVDMLGDVNVRALAILDDCFDGDAAFSFTRLPYSFSECIAMEGVNVAVGGATPWFRVTGEGAHDGKAALRSGAIGDGENSYVEMQVRGEVEVTFWWKISSQNKVRADKHDYLAFSVDGEEVLTLGGGVIDWTNATYAVTGSGRHSLRWTYIKDGADASNEDCAWLDDVVWSPTGKLCAVSFDANGGEVSECERKVREGSAIGDLPQPQRYGYIFDGWFTAVGGGDEVESDTEITDSVTYYAHWRVEITFDANGGTGGKTVTQDYGTALSAPTVTRVGYTFNGWSPAVPATVPAGGATYTAQWKVNQYAVAFDANGGEGSVTNEQDYASEIVPPEVSRTGYSFVGWSPEVGTTVPASNLVYTAQWSVNQYTATFDANGGSGGKAVTQNYGTELVAPSVTRTGYTFVGWRPSVPTAMPAVNRTFVAQWTANKYTVTFDPNGGTGGWSRQMDYGTEIAAPTSTREGYVFNYWLRGRRGDGYTIWYRPPIEAGEKITVADNVTYYAQWTDIAALTQCTVTFNANGGTGSTSRTIEKGVEVGNLPTPIRDGYAFAGWFTAPDGGTQISASTTATADVTYYAHWLVKGPVSSTIKDGVLTSVKLNNETEVTIPDSVKIIGRSAFSDCVSMTCVTIGNGVIGIGDSAFDRCGGLTSITIPDSVTSIGKYAFASCRSLTHVTIGKSVASVGWGAFSGCSALTSVTIPNSVTSIGYNAFGGCSGLTSVTIPNSVTSIGDGAFDGCVALKRIYVSPGDVDRVIGLVTSAGPGLDVSNVNFIEIGMSRVVFDANGGSVNEASRSVASGRAVGVLPAPTRAGCTFDGWWTMMSGGNKVSASTKVTENVTYYAHWKVNRCTVTFDATGGSVSTTSIIVLIGARVGELPTPTRDNDVFKGWYTAASGGVPISSDTVVTSDVTLYAHWGIKGTDSGVEFRIENGVLKDVNLNGSSKVTMPNSVTSIGSYAFYGCSGLTSVTIPNSVTSIGDSAFSGCSGLASVTIPNSVTSIGYDAFYGCTSIKSVSLPETFSVKSVFPSSYGNMTTVTIPANATEIADSAFDGCKQISSIDIPTTVTHIGSCAFRGCSGLTLLIIPENVTDLGASAFSGCNRIREIVIPEGVGELPASLFEGCSGLTTVTTPNSVTNISSTAFKDCGSVVSVTMPGRFALEDVFPSSYTKIKNVTILDGEEFLQAEVFAGCSALTTVVISEGVTTLGEDLFYNLRNLTELTIPSTVTSIGGYAFYGCSSLKTIHVSHDGDIDALKQMLYESGFDTTGVTFDHVKEPVYTYYTVLFNANGGSVEKTEAEVREGAAVGTLPVAERDGYEFLGWFTSTIGGTQVTAATIVTKDVTFYARWKRIGVTSDEEVIAGEKVTIETGLVGYKASGLPSGLKYDAKTGKITGTTKNVTAEAVEVVFTKAGEEEVTMTFEVRAEEVSVGCEALMTGSFQSGVMGAAGGIPIQVETETGIKSVSVTKLPSGMKYDSKNRLITGAPNKPGDYEVVLTLTTASGAKETVKIPVSVVAMPVMAVGKFDGFVAADGDNRGTFTLTTTDAGKLTAKVVTAAGTVSFSGTCWDSVEDGVYRTTLMTKKGEKLTLMLDSTAAWDANQLSGEFTTAAIAETKKTAAVPSRTYVVSAQRNAFGKTWYFTATGDEATGWKLAYTEDTKGAALTVTLKADGSISIAGKLPNGTDTKGKAVTIKVSASGYANVGGLKDGAILADFAPVLTVNKVKTVLAIKTNLWFDRQNDHAEGTGEARFVK